MSRRLAEALFEDARDLYPAEKVKPLIQGVTYVGLENSMILLNCVAHDTNIEMVKHKRMGENRAGDPVYEDEHLVSKRSWAPVISVMQMEDSEGYGYPLKAIGSYASLGSTTSPMMLGSLLRVIMGCSDLWRAIDSKESPFHKYY